MALQFSTTLRNNRIGQVETTIGSSAVLEIRTGSPPASPADADTGTLLVSIALPVVTVPNDRYIRITVVPDLG